MRHRLAAGVTAAVAALLPAACVDNTGPPGDPGPATSTAGTGSASVPSSPGATSPGATSPPPAARAQGAARTAPAPAELPRGGRTIFPDHRLVGFAGHPRSDALGRLGVGNLDDRAKEVEKVAAPLAGGRKLLPVLELIATVVQGAPGPDGDYRVRGSDAMVADYLAAARRVQGILLLDIQPGRSDFLTEVRYYEKWLEQPDVGIALDPEWAMGPDEVPMRTFGHTTGTEIDAVARYLDRIVAKHGLPEKVLVYHQLAPGIVRSENDIRPHQGVVIVKSVDGIGNRAMKEDSYRRLTRSLPEAVHAGFKLFYDEDRHYGRLMTPSQVLALRPRPEYVLYE